ncbi:MCE family protein [Nocardia bovistercoris]|uniref:MCE family protein n=1 Tax=Nocardia bovistercoris TaxID=2785916 RepID=A0A931IH09_9NOCA|nr:MCE family protein [Nocardia bovistercoris]MBH0781211.1 MCE family protein [Nocardia bovistercoris]
MTKARRALLAATAVATVAVTSGCGLTVESLPLPAPGQSGETYTLHAVFENALNLPDQAKVKIGGSDVGVVTGITTKNFQAVVDMSISRDIELPKGSTAELRQATPLGDVFVAISKPKAESGTAMLTDGDTLTLDQTSAGATVEELLVSVSMLFNGGGIASLSRLAAELDSIVGGRGPQLAHLITEMTGVVGSLNENSARIDSVLGNFSTLANTIEARRDELGQVADTLPQMIGVIAENNRAIGDLLAKVSVTSAALGDYANTSSDQLASLMDNLRKLMDALAATGDGFARALENVHQVKPRVDETFKGGNLAIAVILTNLDVGLVTDPANSKFFDTNDLNDFVGSFLQVLQVIQGRVQGGHR